MIVASAVMTGVAVLLGGNLPWVAALAPLNLRVLPVAPWSIVPMALYLWVYWRFIGGRFGSDDTAGFRRTSLRANRLTAPVWMLALLNGLVGFAALVALLFLMARVVEMPPSAPLVTPAGMPAMTAFVLLVMSSIVAAVTIDTAGVDPLVFVNTAALVVLSALFVMLARRLHRFAIPRATALGLISTVE